MGGTLHEPLYNETDGDLIFIRNSSLTHAVMEQFNIYELESNCIRCCWKLSLDGIGQKLCGLWLRPAIWSHGMSWSACPVPSNQDGKWDPEILGIIKDRSETWHISCGIVKMLRCLILSPADFQKNRVNIKNSVYMTITHSSLSGHRKCVPLIVEDSMLLFSGEVPVWGRVSLNTLILIA